MTTPQNNPQAKQRKTVQRRAAAGRSAQKPRKRTALPKAAPKPLEPLTALGPLWPDPLPIEHHADIEIDVRLWDWQKTRISANDRLDPREKNRRTQIWRSAAEAAVLAAGIDPLSWARVVYWVRWPDNRKRETSNLQPTAKAIVDGMVDARVLPDDRDEMVDGPDARRIYPNGPHRVIIQLWRRA
ncbi:RusA-like resolvase [Arthrobacter phage NathanVaag]|nr:RusA-like resolvase [Arthrobacter phage NathanVaag]